MSFRKVLYFAGGLSYPTVNSEVSTVSAPSGFIDYPAWMRLYLVGSPDQPRMAPGIADDARPEAEVVEEVRQMVCDNFDDVMEAFRSQDPTNKGTLNFDEFTRAVLLGLRMTRMTAHHRAAIFHHAKKVKDTDDVDYVDWLQLFAPAHLQQREMARRQPPTLRSTTTSGLVPGQGMDQQASSDNSVSQLIEHLKSLTPTEAVAYLENLHLSEQTQREIMAALKHTPADDVGQQQHMSYASGRHSEEALLREVMNEPISVQDKIQKVKHMNVTPELRVEYLEILEKQELAVLRGYGQ